MKCWSTKLSFPCDYIYFLKHDYYDYSYYYYSDYYFGQGGYGFQKGVGIFSTPSRSIRSAFPENMNFNWDRLNHWKPRKGPGFWKR